jgi:hypothetical protein
VHRSWAHGSSRRRTRHACRYSRHRLRSSRPTCASPEVAWAEESGRRADQGKKTAFQQEQEEQEDDRNRIALGEALIKHTSQQEQEEQEDDRNHIALWEKRSSSTLPTSTQSTTVRVVAIPHSPKQSSLEAQAGKRAVQSFMTARRTYLRARRGGKGLRYPFAQHELDAVRVVESRDPTGRERVELT